MKKYLLAIFIISAVITASGCTNSGNQTSSVNKTQIYSGSEFTFEYPSNWKQATSQAINSTVSFGDPSSADANGNTQVNVVIQKAVKPTGTTLQNYYNATYAQFMAQNLGFKPVSEGSIVINGQSGLEIVYKINSTAPKQQRAIWLQKKNLIYIILCSAPASSYGSQQQNFDTIVNSFKLL
ncbi:MAG: DcrB-related protein [Methanobacterium sp.]|uniref:PsbP-related protein n=1 Tax=Methanobacterium sp. TaxID=2164 RepID=UPI003D64C53C|nr:DcrB-related protein [Methanobacterium sp.]